jgi:hypothetical protein
MKNTVALTILKQLGGNRFLTMTGAKNLLAHTDALSFKLPRNMSKGNYMKITLNGNDLYDIEFSRIHNLEVKVLNTVNDVYKDQLEEIFTSMTGLYTRF